MIINWVFIQSSLCENIDILIKKDVTNEIIIIFVFIIKDLSRIFIAPKKNPEVIYIFLKNISLTLL
jgi:hypothetical protein